MVRLKNRYFVINFLYPSGPTTASKTPVPDLVHIHQPTSDLLTGQILSRLIRKAVADLFGDYGAGAVASGLKINYLSPATSTAIIRAPRSHYRLVWAALTFITSLPNPIHKPCVVRVVRVSGTIRKAEDEVIRRAKDTILKVQKAAAGGSIGHALLQQLGEDNEAHNDDGIEDVDMENDGNKDEDDDEDVGERIERD